MATMAQITTRDGYIIRAFSSLYVDYGLEVTSSDGKERYYGPCALSSESYGWRMCDHCQENGGEHYDCENPVEWTEEEWAAALRHEADDLLDMAMMPTH